MLGVQNTSCRGFLATNSSQSYAPRIILSKALAYTYSDELSALNKSAKQELVGIRQCLKQLQTESVAERFGEEYFALGNRLATHPYFSSLGQLILQSLTSADSSWAEQAKTRLKTLSGQEGSFSEHLTMQVNQWSHWENLLPVAGGIFAGSLVGRLGGIASLAKLGRSYWGRALGGAGIRLASNGVAFLGEGITFSLADRGVRTALDMQVSWGAEAVLQGIGHGLVTMGSFRLSHGFGKGVWQAAHGVRWGVQVTRWVGVARQSYQVSMLSSELGGALASGYLQGEVGQNGNYHLAGALGMMGHFRLAKGMLYSAAPGLHSLQQSLVRKTYELETGTLGSFGKRLWQNVNQAIQAGKPLLASARSLPSTSLMTSQDPPVVKPNSLMGGNLRGGKSSLQARVEEVFGRYPIPKSLLPGERAFLVKAREAFIDIHQGRNSRRATGIVPSTLMRYLQAGEMSHRRREFLQNLRKWFVEDECEETPLEHYGLLYPLPIPENYVPKDSTPQALKESSQAFQNTLETIRSRLSKRYGYYVTEMVVQFQDQPERGRVALSVEPLGMENSDKSYGKVYFKAWGEGQWWIRKIAGNNAYNYLHPLWAHAEVENSWLWLNPFLRFCMRNPSLEEAVAILRPAHLDRALEILKLDYKFMEGPLSSEDLARKKNLEQGRVVIEYSVRYKGGETIPYGYTLSAVGEEHKETKPLHGYIFLQRLSSNAKFSPWLYSDVMGDGTHELTRHLLEEASTYPSWLVANPLFHFHTRRTRGTLRELANLLNFKDLLQMTEHWNLQNIANSSGHDSKLIPTDLNDWIFRFSFRNDEGPYSIKQAPASDSSKLPKSGIVNEITVHYDSDAQRFVLTPRTQRRAGTKALLGEIKSLQPEGVEIREAS